MNFPVFDDAREQIGGNFAFLRGTAVRVAGKLSLGSSYAANLVHIDCHHAVTTGQGVAIANDTIITGTDNHAITGTTMTAPIAIAPPLALRRSRRR